MGVYMSKFCDIYGDYENGLLNIGVVWLEGEYVFFEMGRCVDKMKYWMV